MVFEERKDSMEEIRFWYEDVRKMNLRLKGKVGDTYLFLGHVSMEFSNLQSAEAECDASTMGFALLTEEYNHFFGKDVFA